MANDIDKTSPHYKGDFGSIYEVNKKFPTGGVAGDFVVIEGWAHYWNADRATWCVNAERDSYWDELITNIIEKFKLIKGATYMGIANLDSLPAKVIGAKMYYFATVAGTYKNFGDLVVPQGINVLYSENGSSWVNTTLLEVAQELGVSTNKIVSQKALNDALNLKANQSSVNEALAKKADKEEMNRLLATKANTADVNSKFTEEKKRVDAELAKKFDKESVAQESGEAEDKVMSQKAVHDALASQIGEFTYIARGSESINKTTSSQYMQSLAVVPDNTLLSVKFKNVSIVGDGYIQLYNKTTSTIIYNIIKTDKVAILNIEQGGDILLILNVKGETTLKFDIEYVFFNGLSLFDDINKLSDKTDKNIANVNSRIGEVSDIIGIGDTNNKGHIVDSYSYSELFPKSAIIDINLVNNASYSYPKLGILPAGTTIKVIAKNLKYKGTTGFNIQIYDKTNSAILAIISTGPTGEIEYTLTSETEIWIPINIVNGTLSGDIKVLYGENIHESRLIATWADGMSIKDGILSGITLKAPKGIYEFALGTIDQRNWAIIRKKFSVEKFNDGIETLNVNNKKIIVLEGELLFIYLNNPQIYIQDYTSNQDDNFIVGDENGALSNYTNSDGHGGSIYFSWNIIDIDSIFAFKKDLDSTNYSVSQNKSSIEKIQNSVNVINDEENGNKYRIISVNGVMQLKNITYSKVLFLGNSLLTGFKERGMASTRSGLDYFGHIMSALIKINPLASYKKVSIASWERSLNSDFDTLFSGITWDFDLIIYQGGDNVNDSSNYSTALLALANYLRNKCNSAKIIITGCLLANRVWAEEAAYNASNAIKAEYISYNGWENTIGISNICLENDAYKPSSYAIQTHLNDIGFLDVANKILQSISYDEISAKHNITINSNVKYSAPNIGVVNGIVTIKTYGESQPNISISGGIQVTHLKLSDFEYDNRFANGENDTATYSSIFTMPNADVSILIS